MRLTLLLLKAKGPVKPSYMLATVYLSPLLPQEQEVAIGHLMSPCNAIWKSVTALHNINQLLVDMTAAGPGSVNLETAVIKYVSLLSIIFSYIYIDFHTMEPL